MTLEASLHDLIRQNGVISIGQYMARCNAHYYSTRDPFGTAGDFITAPEISQIFGELIGAWLADCWQSLGGPHATLCELGGGRGTLLADALRATRNVPAFHEQLDIHLVETSPTLRQTQHDKLHTLHPSLHWQDELEPLPPRPLLLIANEFFDALPIEQMATVDGMETEQGITLNDGKLQWRYQADVAREVSPASLDVIRHISNHIHHYGGAALIIDYGYTGGAQGDTLQAMRKHCYTHPLEAAGESDLTAHVNFDALLDAAQNVHGWGVVEQGVFLKRLGAELRTQALCKHASEPQQASLLSGLERLVSPAQMGSLFKCIALTSFANKPAGF